MSNKDIEIELKFPLKNVKQCFEYLNAQAKKVISDLIQKDTYYTPSHRNFLAVQYPFEWLRLRETSKGFSLDYKHFHPENVAKTDYCDEFQTNIENIEALKKILVSLDFKEIVVVEKSRDVWQYQKVEIAIDEVKNLGFFIELEATESFADPKKGKDYLYSILKELKAEIGEEDLRGYPFKILEKQGYDFNKL
ncbi:MAG: hypothetical protein A2744_03135 [Candidatus Buchananbacteria bacterium RIFCSPHIGHO2_01_FULL_44_11]|uniref:CYTH domain-containing protein n=1 Tax=Candidatus Buchananbacteria bacterium RIFCSPHIGHO2_01_FULL_44_11 TaxID=1797535 RepID=A0A1G1Y051_9BACT|nr:MAG: hypothetical protein A2744_03135 [Candidatus Buchananbacteria bacterium RIFCSPHIGHO2_01_FULL_44_11]